MNSYRCRQSLLIVCIYSEYVLPMVMRRTTLDSKRSPAMIAQGLRFWDTCAARHKALGTEAYRAYLVEQIDRLENEACRGQDSEDDGLQATTNCTESFLALRRLVAIVLQERAMLDMSEPEQKDVGFDGTFVALGWW